MRLMQSLGVQAQTFSLPVGEALDDDIGGARQCQSGVSVFTIQVEHETFLPASPNEETGLTA